MRVKFDRKFWLKGIGIFLVLFSWLFFQMGDSFAAVKLNAVKSSNTVLYSPSGTIVYTITITNSGNQAATGVPVVDNIGTINTTLATGSTGAAFTSWTISASSTGAGSTTGSFANNTNLNTVVNVAAGGSVTYTITATVRNNAIGTIKNKGKVNGEDTEEIRHNPAQSSVTAVKTSATTTYTNNVNTVYTITITNTGNGFATGVTVVDNISAITTTQSSGASGVAFTSWTISATSTGTGTTTGTFANNANLNTTVNIAPGGSVTYTISALVSSNSQSEINNRATVNGVDTNVVSHTKKGNGVVSSKTSVTALYQPGGTIVYKINVKNDGNAAVTNINITDAINAVTTLLADGTTAPAFSSWTISAAKVGAGTTTGVFSNNTNLNTTVNIDASGSVTYTITATVKTNAVGVINNTAAINGITTNTVTHQSSPASVVIQKTSPILSYGAGGTISYTLTVSNTGTGFADNIQVKDLLSSVTTQLSTGGTGPAFSSWTLSASPTGTGTTTGTFTNNTNLNTLVDIAPGGNVVYTLLAAVANNAYGTITNQATAGTSTSSISHTSVSSVVSATKTSGTTTYTPNGTIIYTLTINNTGGGFASNIPVKDFLSTNTINLANGSAGAAFSGWTISATTTGIGTTAGTYANNTDLNTTGAIAPGGSIVYTITATTAYNGIGPIKNRANINNVDTAELTHTPVGGNLSITKTSPTTTYMPGGTITYVVTVSNAGAGFATNVLIRDILSANQATLSNGSSGTTFSSNTVSATTTGAGTTNGNYSTSGDLNATVNIAPGGNIVFTIVGTVVTNAAGPITNMASVNNSINSQTLTHTLAAAPMISAVKTSGSTTYSPGGTIVYTLTVNNTGNGVATNVPIQDSLSTITTSLAGGGTGAAFSGWTISATPMGVGTTTGTYTNNADLNTTATIAAGGSVTYTITGTVASQATGIISNQARVNSVATSAINHTSAVANITTTKTSSSATYTPGGTIVYTLTVSNAAGAGFASNIPVQDMISSITTGLANGTTGAAFSNWTINATPTGVGTTIGTFSNSTNLNTTVNIAPGGKVVYTITGTVVSTAVGTISNQATANGVITSPVSHISVPSVLTKTKVSGTTTYTPGGTIVYTLTVSNTGAGFATNVVIEDGLSSITTTVVGGGIGPAFTGWTIEAASTGIGATTGIVTNNSNLNTQVTIAPGGSVAYTITATVANNAIGTIVNRGEVNTADTNTVTHTALLPNVTARKTSATATYAPGGTIIYTLTVSNAAGAGFASNISVQDIMSSITTSLANGTTGTAFNTWTISATPTGIGTTTGVFANNTDLNTTVDIAPGGSVAYTITGTVVNNAIGRIRNTGFVNGLIRSEVGHDSEEAIIEATKTSPTTTYSPGGTIVYLVTINNSGDGYALNVPVKDLISANNVNLSNAGTSRAFSNWTITALTTGVGTTSGTYADNTDLDTRVDIGPNGSVTYTITGTIVNTAVGKITNKATVNLVDTATLTHTSESSTIEGSKASLTTNYAPGGQIVYTITLQNIGNGFAVDIPIVDGLSTIGVTQSDNNYGNAFTNWTITAITSGVGTDAGIFSDNTDLNVLVDIAPGGSVVYTITATVSELADSTITNQATQQGRPIGTIKHEPGGTLVAAVKSSATTTYIPGGTIAYTLTMTNSGTGFADVPVKDLISSNTTNLIGGGIGAAFGSWTISATTTGIGTTPGTYANNSDLDTEVTIAPSGSITYTITGSVVNGATGNITNKATVSSVDTTTVTHTPEAGTVSATKSSSTATYAPGGTVIYTITVNNTGAGYALAVPVKDLISSNTTTLIGGGTGAAFGSWTISATTTGSGTTAGTYINDSDLDTTVNIAPSGSVTYTITGAVVSGATGDINNKGTVDSVDTNLITHTPEAGTVSATKSSSTTTYAPGGTVIYTITVSNTGAGYALNIPVKDLISANTTTLIGGGTGAAFGSWTIGATTTGTGTTSGTYTNSSDLDTTVNIAPSGSVAYTITGTVVSGATGNITNKATVSSVDTTTVTHTPEAGVVSGTKTSGTTTYAPGGTIVYTIQIENTGVGYALNIPVKDLISSNTTTLIGGGTGAAFGSWTIGATTTGVGTTTGTYTNGSDLDTTVNIAPSGSVTYTITGTVVSDATGNITNKANVNGVDTTTVTHTPEAGIVSATKTSSTTTYALGGTIVYTITINNTGAGYALNVPAKDLLSSNTTSLIGGGTGTAFGSWTINATTTGTGTTAGTYTNDSDLDTTVNIAPSGNVTYTITGTVVSGATGNITNKATVSSVDTTTVTHTPEAGVVSATKSSSTTTYAPGGTIVYTITVNNTGAGYALNIPVKDLISSNTTTLIGGGTGAAFGSWTIGATTTGAGTTSGTYTANTDLDTTVNIAPSGSVTYTITGTVVSGATGNITNKGIVDSVDTATVTHIPEAGVVSATKSSSTTTYAPGGTIVYTLQIKNTGTGYALAVPAKDLISSNTTNLIGGGTGTAFGSWTISATTTGTGTTSGTYTDDSDLDTTVNIAPSGSVTYTITGTVVTGATGNITNKATINSVDTTAVTHTPEAGTVSATKSSSTTTYAPGGTIVYTIMVNNTGAGYALDVPVKDLISSNTTTLIGGGTGTAFGSWTISATTTGTGTTAGTYTNNSDLDTTVNIAPSGSVSYTITGTVVNGATGNITNKATVSSVDTTTVTHTPEAGTVSATKSSSTATYAPGGTIVYTLQIKNTGTGYALAVPAKDLISSNTTNLIGGGTGTAFGSWTISATTTGTGTTSGTYTDDSDLDTTVNIAPSGSVTYTITGTVVTGATGNITNKATINSVDTAAVTHTPEAGVVSGTKTSGTTIYAPGGTIVYTITINNTGAGYALNVPAKDLLSSNTTSLIGGGTGTAFGSWTINATTTGTGTTAGTYTNDSDLDTTVNIAPSGNVTYTITGTVVSGATGNITNKATVSSVDTTTVTHTPEAGVVSATKSSSTTTYAPGGTIVYTITVNNTGAGYALNIPVKDLISSNTTTLIGGGTGAAFGSWTIGATTTGVGTTAGTYTNDSDLDTTVNIAPSGSVTYTITGTVVSGATGNITNKGTINSVDTPTVTHTPEAGTVSPTKSSSTTTYAPGGTVSYTITVNNTGSGYALGVPLKDLISSNTTTLIGGGTGAAFGSWTIGATTTGVGTTSGTYTANSDLDTTVNIAPSGSVIYTITGTVVSGATGNITNKAEVNGLDTATVTHTPEAGTVSATKSSSTTTYAPGGTIVYTITVNNTGAGYALDVPVKDLISSNTTTLIGGGTGPAFGSWTIGATTTGAGTISGTYTANTDLDTTVNIAPSGSVTYTITGIVVTGATGNIINKAEVNGLDTTTVTHTPEAGTVSATKSSSTTTYAPGGTIVYTLQVENTGTGYALGVPVKDLISSNTTNLIGGGTGAAFSSWTIGATTTGTGTTVGTYTNDSDLDTTVNIAPSGSVTYTITGTVVSGATGNITNKATVSSVDTTTVTHTPEAGVVSGTKTSGTATYAPGGTIVYTLQVENTGTGYAPGVPVKDLISSNTTNLIGGGTGAAFSSWTIGATTTGTGTTAGTYTNDSDLDTTVNIAPSGSVTYTITGTVVSGATGNITNKAEVNGLDTTTVTHTPEAGTVSATKSSSTTTYAPGGTIVYTITVNNTGAGYALNVPVKDLLSSNNTTLIGGGTGAALSSWMISATTTGTGTTPGTYTNGSDLDTTVNIAPSGSVTYTITGTVVSGATGNITNKATINSVDTTTVTHTPEAGTVSATKSSSTTTYTPGGMIVYTIAVTNTGSGFALNVPIKDVLSTNMTDLFGGGTGATFTSWAISAVTTGVGTSAGTFTDHIDLDTVAQIAPSGSVTYTISALVGTNMAGQILNHATINGTQTPEVSHTLVSGQATGSVVSTSTDYVPNGTITYIITAENNTQGFALNVSIQDFLAGIIVTKADGTTGPAFSNWSISAITLGTSTTDGIFNNNTNLNTFINIDPGGHVVFTIVATVVNDAVGPIINTGLINRVATEVNHTPRAALVSGSKISSTTSYAPGEQIVYTLTLSNAVGAGFANNVDVVDAIGNITTDLGGGRTGPAFSSWTISAVTTGAGTTSGTYGNNMDLNTTVNIATGGSVTYTITATVATRAEGVITNNFTANGTTEGTTTHTRKTKEGLMSLTKTVNESQTKAGGAAGYHIVLVNDLGTTQSNIYIHDYTPIGFNYVEGSASLILPNGEAVPIECRINGAEWIFGPFDLAPDEKIDIMYVVKVSATASAGAYTNRAVAKINGVEVSDQGRATVNISVDTLANTATIIGKVYDDIDGDGWQDPAKASKVWIEQWDLKNAIPTTGKITYYTSEDKVIREKEVTPEEIQKGEFELADQIEGHFRTGNTVDTNKVVFQIELTKPEIGETFTIRTAEGMVLQVEKEQMSDQKSHSDYSKRLTSQAFKVVREIKEEDGRYFFELAVTNIGVQEEGVPGVRLVITSGSVIYTDQYGRYHVPPEIIKNNTGSNYVIKLDPQSLPEGMRVISENPKAKLVSMYGLNEINFEVQYVEEKEKNRKGKQGN